MLFQCLLAVIPFLSAQQTTFRPPAIPLVTTDPYLSIWSESDHLYDTDTVHWTHTPHPLRSAINIDGKTYRLMGADSSIPPLAQTAVTVTPTRSIYQFANNQVTVTLTFMTPLLPDDLKIFSRPVTYLTWTVRSLDKSRHHISITESTSSAICVNSDNEIALAREEHANGLTMLAASIKGPTVFEPAGDDTRINWGTLYAVASDNSLHQITKGNLPDLAFTFDLANVGITPVSKHMMIGYDEWSSIDYFGRHLPPYWYHFYQSPSALFSAAEHEYASLTKRCEDFDKQLSEDLQRTGGEQYAQIAALSYRECIAACGLAEDFSGQPLLFTKENTSNGDIATVDVIFPMEPIFLLLCPSLAKASLVGDFNYAASNRWKFANAPHDLGTYPQVFGRDDGGEGMPVEESGNMIILTDAIAHAEEDPEFADLYWPQLTQWAKFLEQYGLDPEDQLCTDDFMGHLAHNANLSIKAIVALGAYGDLCYMRGDNAAGKKYLEMARADAAHWVQVSDAGDHSLLAFDKPNTWSQKYNLVWDRILGLNIFPPSVASKEIAFYKTVMQPYGLPLDSRTHLTKTDWTTWSASMATSPQDFQFFIAPVYRYLNETTTRDPIADSYMTDDPKSGGMHARPVVGGFFIKMLTDPSTWKKWASRDKAHISGWQKWP